MKTTVRDLVTSLEGEMGVRPVRVTGPPVSLLELPDGKLKILSLGWTPTSLSP